MFSIFCCGEKIVWCKGISQSEKNSWKSNVIADKQTNTSNFRGHFLYPLIMMLTMLIVYQMLKVSILHYINDINFLFWDDHITWTAFHIDDRADAVCNTSIFRTKKVKHLLMDVLKHVWPFLPSSSMRRAWYTWEKYQTININKQLQGSRYNHSFCSTCEKFLSCSADSYALQLYIFFFNNYAAFHLKQDEII